MIVYRFGSYRDGEDSNLHVYVTRAAARQPVAQVTLRTDAPRRTFRAEPEAQRSPDVVMVPETGPDGDDEELLTPRSDSQRKQTVAAAAAAASNTKPPVTCEFGQALAEGWTRVNQGGNGDCASKALAAAMHFNAKQQKLGDEASRTEGGLLRTQILDHLRRY